MNFALSGSEVVNILFVIIEPFGGEFRVHKGKWDVFLNSMHEHVGRESRRGVACRIVCSEDFIKVLVPCVHAAGGVYAK